MDLTRVFSGPFATRHFADFGAEVIKIEPPQGDDSRNFPPLVGEWSGYFEILNRNKKSIVLNLKEKTDLDQFYALCKESDVVVENFSSTVAKKLKIDFSTIKKINPQIIYASITGISENVDKKYYDVIAQADSGIISINGEDDDMKISTSIVDAFSGMKLAYAISSALYAREKTKLGCKITVSMKGSAFDLLEQNLIAASISKENPQKVGNMDNAIAPFGVFKTKDSAVVIAIGNENQWKVFESFLRKNNKFFPADIYASNHLRLQNIKKLKIEIENILRKYSCDDAVKILEALRIPCTKIKTMVDVVDDQENYEEKLLEKINHPVAGEIVVSSGGIFFSEFKKDKYKKAPKLKVKRRV